MRDTINTSNLKAEVENYTKFKFGGYAIQIPYQLGKKYSSVTIYNNLTDLCGGAGSGMTQSQIQSIATNNSSSCGIDCSGLVLRCANESTAGTDTILDYFASKIPGFPTSASKEEQYTNGISANALTNLNSCNLINTVDDIQVGDFIRFDNGGHIGIVKLVSASVPKPSGITTYTITYTHSSGGHGPHDARVIVNNGLSLDDSSAIWNDTNSSYSTFIKNKFNYVCRPKCIL